MSEEIVTSHVSPQPDNVPRGPLLPAERSVIPDLARGAMLLFIAMANAPGLAPGGPALAGRLAEIERAVGALMLVVVNARAYPVFAIMFGYGLVQLATRQEAAGATAAGVRSILLRRNYWLVVFGFLHAALLYFADFLGAYGLIGIAATMILLYRERVQRFVLALWAVSVVEIVVLTVLAAVRLATATGPRAMPPVEIAGSATAPDYATSVVARLSEWPVHTATVLPAIFIVCLGMWAARRRLLEDAHLHRRLLGRLAIGGLGVAFLGGVPFALASAGVLRADQGALTVVSLLHKVSGMFGGPGYIALLALVAMRASRSRSRLVSASIHALTALGQRSLSGYLFQSLAWLLLLAPFTLALGSRFGSPFLTALAVAVVVWLITIAAAVVMQRHAYRGPMEIALRRLTYGRRRMAALAATPWPADMAAPTATPEGANR